MQALMTSRTVLTYGSFDRFHQGHARLLRQISLLGTELIVGCSTDSYNERMGVPALQPYAQRRLMLESCRFVDRVIAEQEWDQKYHDIVNNNVSVLAMGEDWRGQLDHFEDVARVIYIPRAEIIGAAQPFNDVPRPRIALAAAG